MSLEELYDAHAGSLFGFVMQMTRNEADTRDVLQDIFCRLVREPRLLRGVKCPGAFLTRMAYRLVIDRSRRREVRERHRSFQTEVFEPAAEPDEAAFRESLDAAMATLPDEQRAVIHLKLWGGHTFGEIAATLNISSHTAASRYRYGIDKLRTRLRPLYEEIQ